LASGATEVDSDEGSSASESPPSSEQAIALNASTEAIAMDLRARLMLKGRVTLFFTMVLS
jgi:hypothetical protein